METKSPAHQQAPQQKAVPQKSPAGTKKSKSSSSIDDQMGALRNQLAASLQEEMKLRKAAEKIKADAQAEITALQAELRARDDQSASPAKDDAARQTAEESAAPAPAAQLRQKLAAMQQEVDDLRAEASACQELQKKLEVVQHELVAAREGSSAAARRTEQLSKQLTSTQQELSTAQRQAAAALEAKQQLDVGLASAEEARKEAAKEAASSLEAEMRQRREAEERARAAEHEAGVRMEQVTQLQEAIASRDAELKKAQDEVQEQKDAADAAQEVAQVKAAELERTQQMAAELGAKQEQLAALVSQLTAAVQEQQQQGAAASSHAGDAVVQAVLDAAVAAVSRCSRACQQQGIREPGDDDAGEGSCSEHDAQLEQLLMAYLPAQQQQAPATQQVQDIITALVRLLFQRGELMMLGKQKYYEFLLQLKAAAAHGAMVKQEAAEPEQQQPALPDGKPLHLSAVDDVLPMACCVVHAITLLDSSRL
jgi:DNA repair exonuclease SbcCD ATPase subunit